MAEPKSDGEKIVLEHGRSVAGRELPGVPKEYESGYGTIVLFYQYQEPAWSAKESKKALKKVMELGEAHHITGRGRVAPEGLNCTLSGTPQQVRAFCLGLREWNPRLFDQTDFKLTDGIPLSKLFKSLSIRKANELVAYGLAGDHKAPSLEKFAGEHLEADQYHNAMTDQDTVIIDVRNAYESAIGHFQPPSGGAKLIDPKMRNSIEFPKWLNDPETQKQLNGKKVLMYCTGGIRCERATALLNQMSAVNPDTLKPKAVYELRGGIERYLKTYPQGGFWKGKNYLFDRRMEQCPSDLPPDQVEDQVDSTCCLCRQKWTVYRGKFKCATPTLCGVPVIVCTSCESQALKQPHLLKCELCRVGYKTPDAAPDLVGQKRMAEALVVDKTNILSSSSDTKDNDNGPQTKKQRTLVPSEKDESSFHDDRLFLARLPLTVTKSKLEQILGTIQVIHWLTDSKSGAFYGSCVVQLKSASNAKRIMSQLNNGSITIDKKRAKISFAKRGSPEKDIWPPANYTLREFPPIGK